MTFKVLTDDNQNILFCSNLNYAKENIESNLCLGLLCGETHSFVIFLPERYKKSVSYLDNYSRKDEQDKNPPWTKTYLKTKLLEKLGILMHPKYLP